MPNLADLRRRGATARGSLTTMPSKTAPGHAALYTGTWSDRNGIAGNEIVPAGGGHHRHAPAATAPCPCRRSPIWAAAARQDLDVTVVSATQVYPFSTYLSDRRFPGYYAPPPHDVRRLPEPGGPRPRLRRRPTSARRPTEWLGPLPAHDGESAHPRHRRPRRAASTRCSTTIRGDPVPRARHAAADRGRRARRRRDPQAGGPRAMPPPSRGSRCPWPEATPPSTSASSRWPPDGSALTLYRTAPHMRPLEQAAARAGRLRRERRVRRQRGVLALRARPARQAACGMAATAPRSGAISKRVALVVRQVSRLNDFAIDRTGWELLLTYLPFPDEAVHLWYGYLDREPPQPRPRPGGAAPARSSTRSCGWPTARSATSSAAAGRTPSSPWRRSRGDRRGPRAETQRRPEAGGPARPSTPTDASISRAPARTTRPRQYVLINRVGARAASCHRRRRTRCAARWSGLEGRAPGARADRARRARSAHARPRARRSAGRTAATSTCRSRPATTCPLVSRARRWTKIAAARRALPRSGAAGRCMWRSQWPAPAWPQGADLGTIRPDRHRADAVPVARHRAAGAGNRGDLALGAWAQRSHAAAALIESTLRRSLFLPSSSHQRPPPCAPPARAASRARDPPARPQPPDRRLPRPAVPPPSP